METEQARPSDEVGITVHIHKAFWRRSQNVVTDQIRETSGALLGDAALDGAGGWGGTLGRRSDMGDGEELTSWHVTYQPCGLGERIHPCNQQTF